MGESAGRDGAWENRRFLQRAVRFLAEAGIDQFIFIRDSDDPAGILKRFRDMMAPGSYLTVTHGSTDGLPLEELAQIVKVYTKATSPAIFRSREQIKSFFDGTRLIEAGLVHPWEWRPQYGPESPRTKMLYGGVGRIPLSA